MFTWRGFLLGLAFQSGRPAEQHAHAHEEAELAQGLQHRGQVRQEGDGGGSLIPNYSIV